MRLIFVVLPGVVLAGCAGTPPDPRASASEPRAKGPAVEYRSAFDGYRAFKEEELLDWRRVNDDVGAAGGHAGHK